MNTPRDLPPLPERARALLERFETTPLPGAQQRVWRRLARKDAQLERRIVRAQWAFAGVSLGVLTIAITWAWSARGPHGGHDSPRIVFIEGTVHASQAAGLPEGAVPNRRLLPGTTLATAPRGKAKLRLSPRTTLELLEASALSIEVVGEEATALLVEGGLEGEVLAEPAARPVVLWAAPWSVATIGARFELRRTSGEGVSVSVSSGAVSLRGPGVEALVAAGQTYPPAPPAAEEARLEPSQEQEVEATAPVEQVAPPTVERARPQRPRPTTPKRPRGEDDPRKDEATRPSGAEAAEMLSAPGATPREVPPPIERVKPAESVAPATLAPPPAPTEEEMYRRASSQRDPKAAQRSFDAISEGRGRFSELAAHQAARLSMRLGQWEDALGRWVRILRERREGALDQEARLNLLECALRLGRLEQARSELERFVAAHPESERAPELRFVRGELSRRSGHCAAAIEDFRAARASRYAEDATYFLAWCLLKTGDRVEGRAALALYVEKYPEGRHAAEARSRLREAEGTTNP